MAKKTKKTTKPQKKPPLSDDSILAAMMKDAPDDVPTVHDLRNFLHGTSAVEVKPGDLAWQAEEAWIGLITGANDEFRGALTASLREFKHNLRGDDSALENVLIDQCGIAWLESNYFSARAAETANGDLSCLHRRFLLESADRSHRRLALLVKQIGTVRELLRRAGSARGTPPLPATAKASTKATQKRVSTT